MTIESAHYTDPEHTLIQVEGVIENIKNPIVPVEHRFHRRIIEEGIEIVPWQGSTLAQIKTNAKFEVDRKAEAARTRFLTPGDGQALEYVQTQREALDAVAVLDAGGTVDPAGYPMLEAERAARSNAGVRQADGSAYTLADVAREIVDVDIAGWTPAGAEIKRIRRTAKLRIEQAADEAEVQAVLDGLSWPEPATA
ncbi:hypothetical protein [Ferruginivarius sediminum]|uniref:DUF4376 domain-containing protein n=1 Tax=Ferruginivarius sediminum TaxID=2661937 RepID=A0A369TBA5_9PROT|nr:hypothetical protein [Ferruginivarius sediminum]RDD60216.1 hypothetical protein DRB17_19245 [Ferruginivarius sediminum]